MLFFILRKMISCVDPQVSAYMRRSLDLRVGDVSTIQHRLSLHICKKHQFRLIKFVPCTSTVSTFNTLRPRQNGPLFTDDSSKRIFLNENTRISIKVSLKFVPKGPINNIPALVQIMDWRWSGGKPLSEPMMISLLTHICVTRPQWVKALFCNVFCVRKTNNPVTHVLYVTRLVLQQKPVIRSQGEQLYKLISRNTVSQPLWRHDI